MSVVIKLPPEIEASLAALAQAQGVPLSEFLGHLLEEQFAAVTNQKGTLSPAQRAAAWREAAKGLPDTPPLSDDAVSRDSIYNSRG